MKRVNGTGTIDRRHDGRFRVRGTVAGARRTLGVFPTAGEAEGFLAAWSDEVRRGVIVAPTQETLGSYGARWLDRREVHGSRKNAEVRDIDNERSLWSCHVEGTPIASLAIDAIRTRDVEDFVTALRRKRATQIVRTRSGVERRPTNRFVSLSVVKHALRLVRSCLDDAVRREVIALNPAERVEVGRTTSTADGWDFPRVEEIDRLLSCVAIPEPARVLYAVAIFAGLGLSEILHLRWADVHLDADVPGPSLTVRYGKHGKATKSGKTRQVPILPALLPILRAQRERVGHLPYVFSTPSGGHFANGYTAGWPDSGTEGEPRRGPSRWQASRAPSGSTTSDTHAGPTSRSGPGGRRWAPLEIKAMLGHSDLRVTERYTHLADETLHDAARGTTWAPSVEPITTHGTRATTIVGTVGVGPGWPPTTADFSTSPARLERATVGLEGRCSIQLSYGDKPQGLPVERMRRRLLLVGRDRGGGI